MKPRTLLWLFAFAVIIFFVWLLKPTTPYTPPTIDPPKKEEKSRRPDIDYTVPESQVWPDDPKNK